jgi:hypothetical protein
LANRLKLDSLAARLIAAAAIWTMLGLAVGGFVLSHAFRNAALANLDDSLQVDMDGLIAAADPGSDGNVSLADRFLNHRFDRVYSGLYYQIKPEAGGRAQISHSLFDRELSPAATERKGALTGAARPVPTISSCAPCRSASPFPFPIPPRRTTPAPMSSPWRATWPMSTPIRARSTPPCSGRSCFWGWAWWWRS